MTRLRASPVSPRRNYKFHWQKFLTREKIWDTVGRARTPKCIRKNSTPTALETNDRGTNREIWCHHCVKSPIYNRHQTVRVDWRRFLEHAVKFSGKMGQIRTVCEWRVCWARDFLCNTKVANSATFWHFCCSSSCAEWQVNGRSSNFLEHEIATDRATGTRAEDEIGCATSPRWAGFCAEMLRHLPLAEIVEHVCGPF